MFHGIVDHCNALAKTWAGWMGTSLLGAAIVLALVSLLWLVIRRKASPQLGCLLFLLVPLKLFVPPEVTVPLPIASWMPRAVQNNVGPQSTMAPLPLDPRPSWPSVFPPALATEAEVPSTVPSASPIPSTSHHSGGPHSTLSPVAWVMLFWAFGVLALLVRVAHAQFRFLRRVMRSAQPLNSAAVAADFAGLLRRVGIRQHVRIAESDRIASPVVWGVLRPTLILPTGIAASLSAGQLEWVLLHELAHVRRRDLMVNCFQRVAAILHFLNPAVWIANWMIIRLREFACDDLAIVFARGSQVESGEAFLGVMRYAALVQHRPETRLNAALGVFESTSRSSCFQRMSRLLDTDRRVTVKLGVVSLCVVLLTAVLALPQIRAATDRATGRQTAGKEADKQPVSAAMELSLEGLPKLYESVSKSIVRVETTDNINVTGVIVSSDGHILVGHGCGDGDVKVHLSDGRTVTAKAAGWSLEWQLAVMKINEEGPWPAIELGSTKDLKAGEPCLVIGYSPRGDTKFDSSPMARFGFIDRNVPARWFTTTCFPGFFEWAAVVGMDGHLLGVFTCFVGDQSYETAVDVFVANRDALFAGKNLDWVRYPPNPDSIYHIGAGEHPEMLSLRKTDDVLGTEKPPARMSDSELSAVKQIATKTTVRLVSKDRLSFDGKHYDRWSGVIVSEDGYILTCGHADQLPGEKLTVRLSDGRDADAVALGTNPITNIGLVKITTPGSWPFAEIAESSTLRPGDPLVVAGYPRLVAKGQPPRPCWLTERTPEIGATAVEHRPYMIWGTEGNTNYIPSKWSGGGVFNRYGRYVGAGGGSSFTRSEVAKVQWDDLKQIESIDTATGMPHPLRRRFVAPSKAVAQSVVELLVDSKPVGIGTIVDADGWILTKASVLDGKVSCRLPEGSVVIAEKRAESQEHDLALLKIDVGGLSAAEFSDTQPPSIAQVLCAVGPGQVLKPGIVSIETRAIPPEPRWKGNATENTPDGPMISRWSDGRLGWQCLVNLSTMGTKLQTGDIIVSINGHSTPNVATLIQVLEANLPGYCTGDLVSVALRRKGSPMNVLTPLPPAAVVNYWMMDEHDTPRRSDFAAVFDTDIELLQREVGCPLIDVEGRIRGIAIASRGRNETQRGPTSVLPSHVVSRVTKQVMAEADSK